MEECEWEQFFESNPAPPNLETSKQQLEKFCRQQIRDDRPIALVTSGGTTVPLELNTVRLVDEMTTYFEQKRTREENMKTEVCGQLQLRGQRIGVS